MNATNSCHVIPFLVILVLWDSWIHICTMYYGNKASHIEASIDNFLHVGTILHIPNVNPNNGHIWFRQNLYDSQFGSENNVVEYVINFENAFNFLRWNSHIWVFANVKDSYDLEVQLGLWKSRSRDLIHISSKRIFNTFLDLLKIWRACHIVSYDDDTFVINTNEVCYNVWLDVFESTINIDYVHAWILEVTLATLLFIGTITCFHKGPLVVILMQDFGLSLFPLINFWTWLIFLFWRCRNVSLIFRVSRVIFKDEVDLDKKEAWV